MRAVVRSTQRLLASSEAVQGNHASLALDSGLHRNDEGKYIDPVDSRSVEQGIGAPLRPPSSHSKSSSPLRFTRSRSAAAGPEGFFIPFSH